MIQQKILVKRNGEQLLEVIQLDLEMCLLSSRLPPIHKDPCDRFIIAAAQLRGMAVVTTDRRFADYGIKVLT